jgi:hypothetical protein
MLLAGKPTEHGLGTEPCTLQRTGVLIERPYGAKFDPTQIRRSTSRA